ncbi:flavin reductase family protein [Nocardioides sp. Iso805N]|uniref:flavin reductase family protein n=1 Tax=Nocardioides sp. Iso805N TaxID=1283287 RepID=UPI0003681C5E|nr:flavin reductase family protein [Nocardioides sp. Iso805N]
MSQLLLDDGRFREVLGHYPTGVVVITAADAAGQPIGMTIGSFSSVSLDPPLIAYLPMRSSRTFERIRTAESFCVNILAGDQEDLCRRFASGPRDFHGVAWSRSPGGAPLLEGTVGWIECTTYDISEAGDHYLVLGRITDLAVDRPVQPLLFFQGGYGRFTPKSLVALPERDLITGVRLAEAARGELEQLAHRLDAQASALAAAGGDLVVVGATGAPGRPVDPPPGARVPLRPPLGELHVAWQSQEAVHAWLDQIRPADEDLKAAYRRRLEVARARGWAMAMTGSRPEGDFYADLRAYASADLTPERARRIEARITEAAQQYEPVDLVPGQRYDVQSIVAPVFGPEGDVQLVLRVCQLPQQAEATEVLGWIEELTAAARRVSAAEGVSRIFRAIDTGLEQAG